MSMAVRATTLAEILGLGWALGMALFTSLLFALYLGGALSTATTWVALALTVAAVASGARALARTRRDGANAERGSGVLVAVGLTMATVQVAFATWMTLRSPLSYWDSWTTWGFKARMFALGGPPRSYFQDGYTSFGHPDYPLNLPLAESALLRLPGPLGLPLAGLLGPACLLALLLLIYAGLSRVYGRSVAALAAGTLAWVPDLAHWAAMGYADVPLAMYVGAAALYLLLWWRQRRLVDALLMGLLAGGAVWTKNEGMLIAALLVLVYAGGEVLRRDAHMAAWLWSSARLVLAVLAVPLPWLLFKATTDPIGSDYRPLTPALFITHVGRLPTIVLLVGREMLDLTHWSLFWVALAGLPVVMVWWLSPCGRGLLALLFGQVGVLYTLPYVFSAWRPYTEHIHRSADRLLVQAAPLALLLFVEAVDTLARRPVFAGADLAARAIQKPS
jgi:Dolichyl-phosphate-mannose-protein mannosyltransferase